jgi:Fur family ferric uptake transcriptional regulator
VFLNTPAAIAFEDLEPLQQRFDRATLYRTLNSLVERDLVHRIQDPERGTLYGLSMWYSEPRAGGLSEREQPQSHAHFSCDRCGKTFCLTETPIPVLHLPTGYQAAQFDLHVRGVCGPCNQTASEA